MKGPPDQSSASPDPAAQIAALQRELGERRRAEAWHLAQERILEMIATNAPFRDTLHALLAQVEAQVDGVLASVVLIEEDGLHLRQATGPSLPAEYLHSLEGLPIGPAAGSCGTAIFRKQTVIVADIRADPLWAGHRGLAEPFGLRACWSTPIISRQERALGAFAMYYREPRVPSEADLKLMDSAGHLAEIAIERKLAADAVERRVRELTRLREELFASRQMLRTVVDTVPQRIFWKDRHSAYVGCNRALARDHGFEDPIQLVGKTDFEFKPAAEARLYRADDEKVMASDQPKLAYEEPFAKADGTRGWLRTNKVPLHDKDGKVIGVLGTYEDVTEHKRLEEQFRQAQKMDAFGQLAAGVAHDFNNVLTVVQGHLSHLLASDPPKAERMEALRDVYEAAERAANLTRQLLTFSRRQPFQPAATDLNQLIMNASRMLQRMLGETVALEARYAPGLLPVNADVGLIEQVLMNLAVNARDAMPKGGRLMIETSAAEGNGLPPAPGRAAAPHAVLTVRDTGVGIPTEHLPHIFEPFFTTKEVGKGTGLGLATVFGIIEQHGGRIEVESRPEAGTLFRIFLPRLSREELSPAAGGGGLPVRGGNEGILLVEDETPVRIVMRTLLERSGYQVYECASGKAALEAWERCRDHVHLLVTDMVMPHGVGGRDLADRLRAEKPGLKVLYCSGYTDEFLGQDSPLHPGVNFLAKPFDMQRFLACIRDLLDAR